jgi:spermidine synthase
MERIIEELDYQKTPLGELILRRRKSPSVKELVYEVKLNDEMLMSSSVNASEKALATLALEPRKSRLLDVLVGGLGLGYTAAAALEYKNVRHLDIVELLSPVIKWHQDRIIPLGDTLIQNPRCSIIEGDFFEYVRSANAERKYDAILLDIDHAPDCLLQHSHGSFYESNGLEDLYNCIGPGGVFAIWSAWKPKREFFNEVESVFAVVNGHEVSFYNPHINEKMSNWIIVAERHPLPPLYSSHSASGSAGQY